MTPCPNEETMTYYVEKHLTTCDRYKEIVEVTRKIKEQFK